MKSFVFFYLAYCQILFCKSHVFSESYAWGQLEFDFPETLTRTDAINNGIFIPGNGFTIDTDVHYSAKGGRKVFVTAPRYQPGIPATISTISNKSPNGIPLLTPYPNFEWNQNLNKSCAKERMVSVFRIQIDECNRLWVLDSGVVEGVQRCPPQLSIFNVETDEVIHQYEIPSDQFDCKSILITPAIDVIGKDCSNTFAYLADVSGFSLIVYDLKNDDSWKITSRFMYPYPPYGKATINGVSFELMDGIFGLSLSPKKFNGDRLLYFHSFASVYESYVRTSLIRNKTIFQSDPAAFPDEFHVFPGTRPSQSTAQVMDENGIAYFALVEDTSIACWNRRTVYGKKNMGIIDRNEELLQFPSGIKIVRRPNGKRELWTTTNRYQLLANDLIDPKEINYRILSTNLDRALKNNICNRIHKTEKLEKKLKLNEFVFEGLKNNLTGDKKKF